MKNQPEYIRNNCDEKSIHSMLTDYLKRLLPTNEAKKIEEHLDNCPACNMATAYIGMTMRTGK